MSYQADNKSGNYVMLITKEGDWPVTIDTARWKQHLESYEGRTKWKVLAYTETLEEATALRKLMMASQEGT